MYGLFISSFLARAQNSDLEKVKVEELNGKLIKVIYDLEKYKGDVFSAKSMRKGILEKNHSMPSFTSDPALQSGAEKNGLTDISMAAVSNRNFSGIVDTYTDEDPDGKAGKGDPITLYDHLADGLCQK